ASVGANRPTRDRIEVIPRPPSAYSLDCRHLRLHVAGFIDGTAHDFRRTTVPFPGVTEARKRFREHRLLQRGRLPGAPTVGADIDATDHTAAAPCDAAQLDEPLLDRLRVAGRRDHRPGVD